MTSLPQPSVKATQVLHSPPPPPPHRTPRGERWRSLPTVPGLDLALPTVTLHYTPCLPPRHPPCQHPHRKKKPEGTVTSWWWNEVAHCPGARVWPARDLTEPEDCLLAPQPRLCSKNQGLNQSFPADWALRVPLLTYGTESHDVLKQSQRKSKALLPLWCFRAIKEVKGQKIKKTHTQKNLNLFW